MRIDAYTHFFPKKFFDKMQEVAGDYKDMGKRVRSLPALFNLDHRKKMVDGFKDYQQILSYPQPPVETFAKTPAQIDELIRLINDGFAELCAKERDHFPGWVAQISLDAPDAGVREAERAINQLGALGVQIYTNVAGKPLDRPQYLPFWKKMNALGKPIWLHPARGANMPDYIDEKKSLFEIWWTFGWSYETATAMARLVFSKIMDSHPNLKIITHHFGGIVPATKCGLEFFPLEKIVFASDCPFDPEGGTMYPRITLQILDSLNIPKAAREKIDYKNLEAVTGAKLVK